MSRDICIETKRFTLRPLTDADGDQVVRMLDDFEVSRWLTVVPHPYSRADFDDFLTHLSNTSALGGLAIDDGHKILGVVGLDPTLGYWLGREHHGNGTMTEAATALVDYAFRQMDISEIGSGYFRGNLASKAVLEKIGFCETGDVERVNCVSQGIEVDLIKLKLQRNDWEASQ